MVPPGRPKGESPSAQRERESGELVARPLLAAGLLARGVVMLRAVADRLQRTVTLVATSGVRLGSVRVSTPFS